ncbi:MAG TPA: hypothetical protein VEI96_13160 [Thermodesulfovibrionales bacterium]|nr:hypothetical protein [Thermodesulfovibrionales bacterium]
MKKFYSLIFSVFFVLIFSSVSLAGLNLNVGSGMKTKSFNDLSFDQAHICSSSSTDCFAPEKVTFETPVLHISFFSPVVQGCTIHWIVSDPAGTFVDYIPTSNSLSFGSNTFEIPEPLPVGDYVFTAIVVGDVSGQIISDQYRFSVR